MKTIQTALIILKILGDNPLSVKMLSEKLNLHKSSVSRILSTLRNEKFVRLNDEKKYELGYEIFQLANKFSDNLELLNISRPYLEYLNKITGETVHIGILNETEIVYLDKIECSHPIRMYSRIGKRVDAYCTGLGKSILAYLPKKNLEEVLDRISFVPYTANTIKNKSDLIKELNEIKESGIACDNGEHEDDIFCISAPIFDFHKKVIASISISATKKYKDLEALQAFEENLKQTCAEISEKLGF